MCEERWCRFRRIQIETTVRQNMGRTFWWLAPEVMMKILRATLIQGDDVRTSKDGFGRVET